MSREQEIYDLLEDTVEALGFELWGVKYRSNGKFSTLQLFIDSENGISVDDCAVVSRQVSGILDVEDPISSAYDLQVSSPGMDRELFFSDQYETYVGEKLSLKLSQMVNKARKWKGFLAAVTDEQISIKISNGDEVTIPFAVIEKAQVIPTFDSADSSAKSKKKDT